ncbi:DALR anticodon-binding domain-containing protein [Metabacillus malikii]|uniref:arginine--tRNA ligase n=1 Tax=Metabacillus malikii TaxID=1504265 RepID=A0ABT9ZCC2_9BACI|nr:DALR anticodon-binding domain-containing protein [Metabacillus malikii]MDQ0229914.1 arginyl-tRNA synthetase [Metabacillus malikii]
MKLHAFPATILRAIEAYDPSQIARYVLDLAKLFNKYDGSVRILPDDPGKPDRLALVQSVQIVLKEGLRLLGIHAQDEM